MSTKLTPRNIKTPRIGAFKIGHVHGQTPVKENIEARLRNYIYGAGLLQVVARKGSRISIRIIGYEVPLAQAARGCCIDLLGYDAEFRPWAIELKKGTSDEKLPEVVEQVRFYADAFDSGLLRGVEQEIQNSFFWPQFRFSGPCKKMILAHRSFFLNQPMSDASEDVLFCSFGRVQEEERFLSNPRSPVLLKVERQAK